MKKFVFLGVLLAISTTSAFAGDAKREALPSWLAGAEPPTVSKEAPLPKDFYKLPDATTVDTAGEAPETVPSEQLPDVPMNSTKASLPPSPSVPIPVKPAAAPVKPTFENAVKAFNDRRYKDSMDLFEQLGPRTRTEQVQYYMGRCAQQMAQVVKAREHYSWVLQYGKDPTLRAYAGTGFSQMGAYSQHRTYAGNGNVGRG